MTTWEIRQGDVLDRLREMPDESVHCVVTSPPYWGLRSYLPGEHEDKAREMGSEPTPAEYIARMVAVFREVRRVLRSDGTCWVNMGDGYAHSSSGGGGAVDVRTDGRNTTPGDKVRGRMGGANTMAPGLKPKDLIGMPWRLAFALQADGWWLRSEIIWCLSGGTSVYAQTATTEGPATIHDLVRLDPSTVKLWNGERWTQVRGWSNRQSETLRITLRSGERIIATPNHRWPLADERIVETRDLVVGDVLATTLLPEPEHPTDEGIPADLAWFAGLYMAEGSRSDDAIQIAGHAKETERHERTAEIARRYGGSAVVHAGAGAGVSVVVHGAFLNAAISHFMGGRTALDKHIHPRAWRSSNATLRAFMEGYLAGDGHNDEANDRWRLGFGNNPQLAASLRTLAARLGATLTLSPVLARMGRTLTFEAYRGEWRWQASAHHNAKPRAEVLKIEPRAATEVWDIGVEDEPHLFALASGILTHNSKPNPMPESIRDRPTKAHEQIFLLTKAARYFYDADAVREPSEMRPQNRYTDGRGPKDIGYADHRKAPGMEAPTGRNARSVWTIPSFAFPGAHFATFPPEIPRRCIAAGTSERGVCGECGAPWRRTTEATPEYAALKQQVSGYRSSELESLGRKVKNNSAVKGADYTTTGWEPTCAHADAAVVPATVLDIFAGAGTTIMVALRMGRSGIGIELSPEYAAMARRRIQNDIDNPKTAKKKRTPKAKSPTILTKHLQGALF